MSAPIRTNNQDKKATIETFMQIGMVMLHLDARVPGVRVPPAFQNEFQLRLNVSPRFDPPDLFMDEWGVRQTLSFQGRRFPVAIPWIAIFGVSSAAGELRIYPHSIPDEVYESLAISQGRNREELLREIAQRPRDDGTMPAQCFTFCPPGGSPTAIGAENAGAQRPAEADVRLKTEADKDAGEGVGGPKPKLIRKKGGLSLVVTENVPVEAPEQEKQAAEEKPAKKSRASRKPGTTAAKKTSSGKKRGAAETADAAEGASKDAAESAAEETKKQAGKTSKPRKSAGKKTAGQEDAKKKASGTQAKKAAKGEEKEKPPAPKPFKLHFVE